MDRYFSGVSIELGIYGEFLSGFIAMVAMLVPGISGSMVLVMLGTYDTILFAIKTVNIASLIPFGLGILFGGVSCVKGIQYLIKQYSNAFESFVIGLLLGSVVYMMGLVDVMTVQPLWGIGLFAIGLIVSKQLAGYVNR